MPSIRDIKKKIGGIKNTQQITKAMKMVSTAKLRKVLDKLRSTKFYLEKFEQIVADLKDVIGPGSSHPLVAHREIKCSGIVLITGERGLCGSFNHDLLKRANEVIKTHTGSARKLFVIGKKGKDFFQSRGIEPDLFISPASNQFSVTEIRTIAQETINFYLEHKIDELTIVYTSFRSALERSVKVARLLPLEDFGDTKISRREEHEEILYEPSPEVILDALIPRFVEVEFTRAILESEASEQAARMIAMTSATDRAQEMIEEMTLFFNRTRQALITRELTEIIGGADALKE